MSKESLIDKLKEHAFDAEYGDGVLQAVPLYIIEEAIASYVPSYNEVFWKYIRKLRHIYFSDDQRAVPFGKEKPDDPTQLTYIDRKYKEFLEKLYKAVGEWP